MQIDEKELARRLGSNKNLVNHLELHHHGRREGGKNLTDEQRDVIGNLSYSVPRPALVDMLGVSAGEVSNCRTGNVGGRGLNTDRRARREEFLETAKDTALSKLMDSLGLITKDKMEGCEVKELASVASQMSKVYSSLAPVTQNQASVTINLYAPEQKETSKYKVVDL